ncbi:hypothetical protein DFH27DRAFT_210451 [Peziza echinospora]|nr:hypothetical protein DFH27DRAFT_210451 [Peziza echinospora]
MARLEAERIEKERLEKERAAWEKYEAEQARIRREEAERAEAFRQQQLRREEEERLALERARLEEEERARQEKQQKEEQERIRREEAERAEALRQQQLQREEELLALEKARLEEEEQARREQQRKEEEEKIRRQKEDEEKEALRQQQQREEEERIALERVRVEEEERACQEQEQKQKEEQERLAALEVLRLEEEEKEKERVAAEVAAAAEAERFEAWQQQQRELERLRAEEEERMERDLALEQERIHAEHQAQLEAMRLEEDRLAEERRAEQEAEEARRAAEQQAAAEAAEREAAEELARRATAEEQARGLAAEKRAREEEARIAAEEELRKQEALHAEQAAAAARVAEELAREEAENASRVAEMQRKLEALMEQHRKQTEEAAAAAAATVITAHSDQEQTSRSADTAPIERGRDTAPASLDRSPAADADRERSLQGEPDEERAERRRARSLIRQSREASPEYREETRRRSRDREREREKERKAEVENMRRILGLDDTTPDTTLDDEAPPPPPPNLSDLIDDDDEDEDGNNNPPETTVLVTVPEISNWVAPWPIPRLVEIVPTPRPGKERPPAKVFVDGTGFSQEAESEDYFNYSHVVVDASPAAPEVNAELVRSEPDHEAFNFTIPPPPPDASNDLWSEPSSPIEEYMPEFPIVQTDSISVPEIIALPDTSDGVTEEPAASPTQIALPAENDEDVYRELAPLVTLFPVPVTQNDTQETISEGISRGDHTLASENDLPPTTASTIAEISSSPPSAESTPIISEEISTNTSVVEEAKSSPSLHSADINHPESPIENVETSILNAAVTRGQEESAAYLPTEIALPESPIEKAEVSANATDIQGVDISFPEVIPFPVDVALPASPIEQHEKPSEKTATISEPTNIVKSEAAQASSSIPPAVQHINPDYWVDAAESPVHGIPVKNREAVPEMVSENIIPPAEITINESTIISHVNPDYWKDDADAAIPVSDHIDVQGDVEVEKNMEDRETEQPVPAPNDVDIDPNPQIQESEHIVEVEQEGTNTVTSKPADFDQASPTGDFEFVQDTRSDSPKPEYASLPGTPGDMTPPELINAARLSRPRSFESPEDAEEISHDAVRGVEQDAEFMALLTAVAEASGFETRDVLDHRVNVEEEPLSPPPVPTSLRRGSQIPFVEEVADEEQGGALTPQYRALPPKEDWTIPSQFPALSKLQKKTSPTMAAATDDISARLIDYPSNSSASRRASISGAYTSGQITPSDLTPNPSPPGTVAARIRRAVTNPHPPSSDSGIGDDEQSRVSSMMPSSSYADGMRNYSPPPSINWKNGDQDNGISVDHNERRLRRRQEREIPFGAVLNRAASMDALGKRPASAFQDKLKFWNNSAGPDEIVAPVTINRTRSTSPINAGPQIRKGLFDQPPMPFTEQPPKSLKRSQTWAALRRKSSTPEIDAVSPQLNFSPPIAEAKAIPEPEKATSPSSPPPSNQEQLSKLVASRGVSQTPSPSPLDTVGFPYHVPADANSWGRKLGKFFEYPFPAQKQISPQSSLRFEDLDIDEGDADETLVGEQGDSSVQIIADVANTVAPLEKSPEVEVQDISQVESTFTEIELPQQNSSNEIISSVPDVTEDSTELNAPPPAGRRRKGKKRKSIPSMNQQNTVSEIEAAAIPLPAEEETLTELLPEAQVEVPVEKPSVDDQVPEEAATTTPQEQQADEVLLPAESTEVSEAPIVAQALEPVIIPRRNIEDEARSAPTSSWSDYFSINKGKGKETEVQETSRSLSSEAAEGNSPVVVEAPLTETPIWVPLPEDEQGQSPVDERPSSPIRVDDVNSSEVQITEEEVSDDDDEDTEPLPTMPLSPILEEAADSDEELQPEAHPAPEYVPFSLESIPEEDDEDYEDNYDVPTATEIAQEDIWHADPIPADGDLGLYLQQLHGDGIDVPQRPISSASSTRRRKRRKRRSLGDINNQEENTLDEPLAKAEDKEEMAPEGNNRSQDEQAQHNTQEEKQEDKAQVNVMEEIREVQLDTTEDKSLDKEADVVPLDTTDASQTAEVASEERFIDKYVPEDNQVRSEAANEDTVEEGAKATEDIFTEPSNTQDTAHEVFSSHEAVSEAQGASTQPLPEQVQQAAPPEAPKVPKLKRFLGMALKAKKAEAEKLNSPTSGPNSPQSTTQSSIQGERKLPRRVPKLAQISDELSLWMKADKKMGQSPLKFNHVTQSEPSLVSPSSSRLPRLNSSLGPSTDDASPQSQTHSPVYSENDTPQLHSRPSFSQLPRLKRTSTEPVLPMAHNLPIKHYPATTDDIPDFPSRIPRVPSQTIRLVDPEPDELGAPTPNRFGFRRSPSIASLTPSITEEPKPVSVPITSIASASTASLEKVADSGASTSSAGSSSSKSFGFLKAAKKFSFKKSKKVKPADQATPEYEQQQPVYPESRPISDSMSGESQDEKERQRALAGVRRRDPEEMSLPSSASSARSTNFPTPSGMRESFIMPFAESWTEVQKESPRMSATPEELGSSAIAAMELPISAVVEQLEAAKEEQVPESQNDSHGPDNGPREHEADQQSAAARDVGSAPSVNSPAAPIATPVHADAGAGEDAPRQSLSQPAPRNHVDKSHNIPSAAEESVHTISTSTSTSAPSLAALDDAVAVEAQSLDRSDGIHAGAFPGTPEGEAPAARPAKLARSRSGKGKKRASATNEDTPEASTSVAPKEGAQNATSVESAAEEINVANPEIEPAAVVEPIADLPTIPEDAPLTEAVESPEAPILQRSLSKRKTNRRTSIDSIATLDEDDQGDSDDDDDNDTLNNSRTHTRSGSPTPSEFSIGGEEGGLKRSGSKKKKRKNKSGSQRRKESRLKRASLTGLAEASKEAEAQAKAQSESQPAPQPVATPSAPVKKPSITELVRAKTAALKASNPELLSKSGASGSGAESKEQQGWTEKGNSSPISTKAQHRQSSLQALSGSSDPLLKAVDSESQEASLASTAEEGSQSATSGDQAREGIPEPQQVYKHESDVLASLGLLEPGLTSDIISPTQILPESQTQTQTRGAFLGRSLEEINSSDSEEDEEDEESDEEDKNEEENGRNQGKDKEDDKDEEGAPPSQQPPSSSVRSIFGPHEDEQPNRESPK